MEKLKMDKIERSHSAELYRSSPTSPSEESSPTSTSHRKIGSRKSSGERLWGNRKGSEGDRPEKGKEKERKASGERKGSGEIKGWMMEKISSDRKSSLEKRSSSSDLTSNRELQLFESIKEKDSDVSELRQILREGGVDVNWRNPNKSRFTVLHRACFFGNHKAVRVLLGIPDIDVNRQANSEWSPFWLACYKGHVEVVKELLKDPRVNVNLPDNIGASPLWWASCNGSVEVVQWMFVSGRTFETSTKEDRGQWKLNGLDPLEIAQKQERKEVVDLIKRYNEDPQKLRQELKEQLQIKDHRNAELFAVLVFLSDGYLSLKPNSESTHPEIHRFFGILQSLPMELQMVFCNRMFGSSQDVIHISDTEEALYRVTLAFRRDARFKIKRTGSDKGSCLAM